MFWHLWTRPLKLRVWGMVMSRILELGLRLWLQAGRGLPRFPFQ